MKTSKKIFSLALALVMSLGLVFSFAAKASAEEVTPSITITNPEKGKDYAAYKVFDATYDTATQTAAYTIDINSPWYSAVNAATDTFTLTDGSDANTKYVGVKDGADVITFLKTNFPQLTLDADYEATANGTPIVWSPVDAGYYYITTTNGSAVTINKATPTVEVTDKNSRTPELPPESEGGGKKADNKTYAVGETVHYTLTVRTVNYVVKTEGAEPEKVLNYKIVDTSVMDGATTGDLKIDTDSFAVKVNGNAITSGYTITPTAAADGFTAVVNWTDAEGKHLYDTGSVLTIEYDAEVLKESVSDSKADNHATFTYNDSKPIGDEFEVVKNYDLEVYKWGLGKDDAATPLAGAQFEIYKDATGGTPIKLVDEGNGVYHVADSTETTTTTTITTPANGKVFVNGFKGGNTDYYLLETNAPNGYNKLTDRIKVTFADEDLTGDSKVEIENQKGAVLPTTGGMGTTIFYTVGGILVVGAAVLLITKKRMEGEQR